MEKRLKHFFKVALFIISSVVMWTILYVQINTANGIFSHNYLSGAMLVVPVLIINLFGGHIFAKTMIEQNSSVSTNQQGK